MSPHQEFIDRWCKAYEARFGSPYVVQGGKDGIAVKKLLASGIDIESAISNAKRAWDLPQSSKFWNCNTQAATLAGFHGAYSKIVVELSNTRPRLQRQGGF
jgi:hypothetical protein